MNPAEFANIRQSEEHFWWYRGMRRILFHMLEPFLAVRTIDSALEAGCGTGYSAQPAWAVRARAATVHAAAADGIIHRCGCASVALQLRELAADAGGAGQVPAD